MGGPRLPTCSTVAQSPMIQAASVSNAASSVDQVGLRLRTPRMCVRNVSTSQPCTHKHKETYRNGPDFSNT